MGKNFVSLARPLPRSFLVSLSVSLPSGCSYLSTDLTTGLSSSAPLSLPFHADPSRAGHPLPSPGRGNPWPFTRTGSLFKGRSCKGETHGLV